MKVAKFGGSSLANAVQIKKVFEIVKADSARKIIIVSAPGKRNPTDIKVTDALIDYYKAYKNHESLDLPQKWILERFSSLATELGLAELFPLIRTKILSLATMALENRFTYDHFLSVGEECSAYLVAAFFSKNGLKAQFVSPQDAGIFVTDESTQARLLPQAYKKIRHLSELSDILVIPGFFGATLSGKRCTFSRGGSDITGAIIAAGVKAELYENFTDVDGIFAAHPKVVKNPVLIEEVTYREMRELAFSGFAVLHDEALIPAARAGIPMVLKNTNRPELPGTRIVPDWTIDMAIVGIASASGFSIVKINKYMLQRELGFVRKFFEIFEQLGIHFEAITTGIDDLSVLVRQIYLTPQIASALEASVIEGLHPDEFAIERNLSVVTAVSEEIRQQTHITSRATRALSQQNIKIETLMQGASEVSLLFIVKGIDEKKTVCTLYNEFFESSK